MKQLCTTVLAFTLLLTPPLTPLARAEPEPVPPEKCDAPLDPSRDAPQCIDTGTPAPRIGIWTPKPYLANVLGKLEKCNADKKALEKVVAEKEKPVIVSGHSTAVLVVAVVVSVVAGGAIVVGIQRSSR